METPGSDGLHADAPHHLPFFITPPGGSDGLMIATGMFLLAAIVGIGVLYFRLHALPEQMAHRGQKVQFELVAVLALLALFTHNHVFWVAGLLLALVPLPDFTTPLTTIATSLEKIANGQMQPVARSGPESESAAETSAATPAPSASMQPIAASADAASAATTDAESRS